MSKKVNRTKIGGTVKLELGKAYVLADLGEYVLCAYENGEAVEVCRESGTCRNLDVNVDTGMLQIVGGRGYGKKASQREMEEVIGEIRKGLRDN